MRRATRLCLRGRCFALVGGAMIAALAVGLSVGLAGPGAGEEKPPAAAKAGGADRMTLKPFAEVEAQEFDWGWIRWTMNAEHDPNATMTFGVVYLKPHQTNPLHMHPNADEILHVLKGSCEHRMGDRWVKMGPGDTIRIPKGVAHNARTLDQPCRVVAVYDTGKRQFVEVEKD